MNLSNIKIGIIHSVVGKNDGVSIVIDQTIEAMIKHMGIRLGNIYSLAAHAPMRFNTTLDDIFWHNNDANRYILKYFSDRKIPSDLDAFIYANASYAKRIIEKFVHENNIDLLIVHNGCHPSNFVYATAVGMFFEELRNENKKMPLYLLWWHDSHLERTRFEKPNNIIKKYLKYIPGDFVDAIAFINSEQEKIAEKYYEKQGKIDEKMFFKEKTVTIPNTCSVQWDWRAKMYLDDASIIAPPEDHYNKNFLEDIGLIDELKKRNKTLGNTVLLLQHTRIVHRKRIDVSIDFAFKLQKLFKEKNNPKTVALIVSGHSGDEHDEYKQHLFNYMKKKFKIQNNFSENNVILLFAEHRILPEKEVIVDKKYYRFADVPAIIAKYGGMGTYFSEVEGYGNNLLEMISMGLPVVINKYPVYKSDIEKLKFKLPASENARLPDELMEECYKILTDIQLRNDTIINNLQVLEKKLNHKVVAAKLTKLFQNLFK
ncbi:MAG: hypothetical protein U9O87_05695 [Verrucomicrobiota bacterium]|nr:hypothetical protein [Verrucomicrobiota bacterium]